MSVCEEKVIARRFHSRMMLLDDVYTRCGDGIPFSDRELYVEARLEARFKYFRTLDDLNSKDSEIDDIMRMLQKSGNN